ncbi:MAG TPA: Rho termination protein [Cyanobacteria bacterium UBA11149]|nr:Rho termination protein [Cyanobacteria bacterium UBA11367]HBE56101.1 Rho termination protein [Cyanobacteria bacterium UBA11366]HBK65912.1 Rho termination protein [Cyanobacteria bacterium UBA11166]HBR74567.1 Rho termination protein [Cyanobacteria bacterium UBA11159]HBS72577.1 Rho termination protein [Cyanobacteria bacterium UBA11153]HBW88467.1 Rho termination protein [Cyanobacteria bacterium UBA11149]HCA93741.1 Rho termination protein [Cyanobacteria bacterium UBA9226]
MAKERPPLEEMTLRQLRRVASECGVSRYSRMRKTQLLEEIQKIQSTRITINSSLTVEAQSEVEASKFELGQEDRSGGNLASVDQGLADLPGGYGESRIVLMPRDPQWAYTYWDIPNEVKEELRRQGGQQLALRIYDVTDINIEYQSPHSIQEYPADEMAREWYLPIPVSDRDYVVDIGYRCADGRWLVLGRSLPVHIPPVYPSDWIEDSFITVNWEDDLRGKTLFELVPPSKKIPVTEENPFYQEMLESANKQRTDGSLFGSMQHVPGSMVPQQAISSYVFPSGVGMWAAPNMSGVGMSGVGMMGMSAMGMSGVGMSGVGMSGVGMSVGAIPIRPRQFWLVADAELIVYGATEPDATVTIGGRPIKLNPDGTFRFQMSFQDGLIDYPIMAVAADGEQTRSIHMKFNRETPSRNTNTKAEAVVEWLA